MEILRPYISEALISSSFGFTEETVEIGGKEEKAMILEGEFQRANDPNKNKRIYSEELLQRETKKLQEIIKQRNGHPAGLDHPMPNPNDPPQIQMQQIKRIGLENACALITNLEMNNSVVYGKAKVLKGDFGTGDKLSVFVRNGFKPAISSRGLGGDPLMRDGFMYVPESYSMVTYDFVLDPSTRNAILEQTFHEEMLLFESINKKHKRNLWEVMIQLDKKYQG